jgi:hypothetical protein
VERVVVGKGYKDSRGSNEDNRVFEPATTAWGIGGKQTCNNRLGEQTRVRLLAGSSALAINMSTLTYIEYSDEPRLIQPIASELSQTWGTIRHGVLGNVLSCENSIKSWMASDVSIINVHGQKRKQV